MNDQQTKREERPKSGTSTRDGTPGVEAPASTGTVKDHPPAANETGLAENAGDARVRAREHDPIIEIVWIR